jgi:hypothetical protein
MTRSKGKKIERKTGKTEKRRRKKAIENVKGKSENKTDKRRQMDA